MLRLMGWSAFAYDTQVSSKAASENPADGLGSGARADCLTVGGFLPTEPRPQGPMDATRGLRTAGRDVRYSDDVSLRGSACGRSHRVPSLRTGDLELSLIVARFRFNTFARTKCLAGRS